MQLVGSKDAASRSIHIEYHALIVAVINHCIDGIKYVSMIVCTRTVFADFSLHIDNSYIVMAEIGLDLCDICSLKLAFKVLYQLVAARSEKHYHQNHCTYYHKSLCPCRYRLLRLFWRGRGGVVAETPISVILHLFFLSFLSFLHLIFSVL